MTFDELTPLPGAEVKGHEVGRKLTVAVPQKPASSMGTLMMTWGVGGKIWKNDEMPQKMGLEMVGWCCKHELMNDPMR